MQDLKKTGKVDMVIITDACLSISPSLKESFLAWKKKYDVKVQSIVIGTTPGVMPEISESVCIVDCVDVESMGVQKAFSI